MLTTCAIWPCLQWDAALGTSFNLARELFESITGINSGTTLAWGTTVQPALTLANLRIETTSRLAIVLPQIVNYQIASPETLRVTLPAAVLESRRSIVASPQLVIQADRGSLVIRVDNEYDFNTEKSILETSTPRSHDLNTARRRALSA